MTILPQLPLEVMMHICDIVADNDDSATLKNCALASSRLSRICQRHLFAKVALEFHTYDEADGLPNPLRRLEMALDVHPELGTYIKSLSIQFDGWYDYPSVVSILPRCTQVATLHLSGDDMYTAEDPLWSTALPTPTREALESLLHSPTLTEASIEAFKLPISTLFSGCHTSLKSLTIICEGKTPENLQKGMVGPPILLHHLNVEPNTLFQLLSAEREDGQAVFDFSQLKELSIRFRADHDHVNSVNMLLRGGAPVEKLTLLFDSKLVYLYHWIWSLTR